MFKKHKARATLQQQQQHDDLKKKGALPTFQKEISLFAIYQRAEGTCTTVHRSISSICYNPRLIRYCNPGLILFFFSGKGNRTSTGGRVQQQETDGQKRVSNLIVWRASSYLPGIDTVCAASKGGNTLSDPELRRRRLARRPGTWQVVARG